MTLPTLCDLGDTISRKVVDHIAYLTAILLWGNYLRTAIDYLLQLPCVQVASWQLSNKMILYCIDVAVSACWHSVWYRWQQVSSCQFVRINWQLTVMRLRHECTLKILTTTSCPELDHCIIWQHQLRDQIYASKVESDKVYLCSFHHHISHYYWPC